MIRVRIKIFAVQRAYKQLFGSCDVKPVAPDKYYYPKPEAEKAQIYIAGYVISTRGIEMSFITADGKPYYPVSYKVRKMGDCVAEVSLGYERHQLTCLPDTLAYSQTETPIRPTSTE